MESFKFFNDMPSDMLEEFISRVGAHSVADLINCMLVNKEWKQTSKFPKIFEHLNFEDCKRMRNFNVAQTQNEMLKKCYDVGNPEALFQHGYNSYFQSEEFESGLNDLNKAATKGHHVANYLRGIILNTRGGEKKYEGLKILFAMHRLIGTSGVIRCREKLQQFVGRRWDQPQLIFWDNEEERKFRSYIHKCPCREKPYYEFDLLEPYNPWTDHLQFGDFHCLTCFWEIETYRFCKIGRY